MTFSPKSTSSINRYGALFTGSLRKSFERGRGSEHELSDLDCVQRRALAEVVVDGPKCQAVGLGRILPDAADEHVVAPGGLGRCREGRKRHMRSRGEDRPSLVRRQPLLRLDPDRL